MKRTKPYAPNKYKRTKPKKIERTENRNKLIQHVLIYFPHWIDKVDYMSNRFLLANTWPDRRYEFEQLMRNEL